MDTNAMRNALRTLLTKRFPKLLHAARLLRGTPYIQVRQNSYPVLLEYPVHCEPRWGHGKASHPELSRLIDANRQRYKETLRSFSSLADELATIPRNANIGDPDMPNWENGWIPSLDGIAIYSFLALQERKHYFEVGSGNSTKFARQAVKAHKWRTRIVSIDPQPRAEIDRLCDEIARARLEELEPSIFDRLEPGDVLFIDNSHYSFMGSDVTVFFFDVLPRLKPGVIVGIHDIFLPDDYLGEWRERYYNEQYLMGCWLLGGGRRIDLILPAYFVSNDPELSGVISPVYSSGGLVGMRPQGHALWFQVGSV